MGNEQNQDNEKNPMIKVIDDTKGNVGSLTVKFLAEISHHLKRIADHLEQKDK